MNDDAANAREKLAQLATQGRAQSEAKQTAEQRVREQFEREREQERRSASTLSTFAAWRSTTLWVDFAVASGLLSAFSLPWYVAGILPWSLGGFAASGVFFCLAWFARFRARAFIRSHPFPLLGYGETLHHPSRGGTDQFVGAQNVQLKIVFVDRVTDGKTLRDAFHAKAGKNFKAGHYDGRKFDLALVGGSDVDGHRRWLHRTMRRLSPVLRAVHAISPIESVTLVGD